MCPTFAIVGHCDAFETLGRICLDDFSLLPGVLVVHVFCCSSICEGSFYVSFDVVREHVIDPMPRPVVYPRVVLLRCSPCSEVVVKAVTLQDT